MEIYDIAIAPGEVRDIFCQGSYVYFYSGNAGGADATITVNQDSRGQRVLLMPGQAYRMPGGETGTRWLIGNLKGEGTIVGRLVIGSGELTDNRVTGSVEVVDGEKSRTLAGLMFSASATVPTLASTYSEVQIYNPAASKKNVIVKGLNISTGTTQAMRLGMTQTEFETDVSANRIFCKLSQNIIPTAKVRGRTTASMTVQNIMQAYNIAANDLIKWDMAGPMVLKPGWGFAAYSTAENAGLTMNVEWFEEPI